MEERDKAREAMPTQVEKTVSDGSDTVEKGNKKGKGKSVRAKQRAMGTISTGWEIRREKGRNETSQRRVSDFAGNAMRAKLFFSLLAIRPI